MMAILPENLAVAPHELTRAEFMGDMALESTNPDVALDDDACIFVLEILNDADWGPKLFTDGRYSIRQHRLWDEEKNAMLFFDNEVVGFYEHANLWIHPSHRGKRLSVPLILHTAVLRGGSVLPYGMQAQHYTPAGFIAHRLAHLVAVVEAIKNGASLPEKVRAEYGVPLDSAMQSEWLLRHMEGLRLYGA